MHRPSAEPLGRFGVYEGAVGLASVVAQPHALGRRLNLIRQSISTRNASDGAVDLGLVYDLNPQLYPAQRYAMQVMWGSSTASRPRYRAKSASACPTPTR